MTSESIVNVTEAQAKLNQLISRDSFAISRHGKIVGIYLSRDRIEALVETMEILGNAAARKAIRQHEAGKLSFHPLSALDEDEG